MDKTDRPQAHYVTQPKGYKRRMREPGPMQLRYTDMEVGKARNYYNTIAPNSTNADKCQTPHVPHN